MEDCGRNEDFSSSEETFRAKKYGELAPKKKPLISKDHERAFFDSADWALCKQGAEVNQKAKVAIETLQPKLQRTNREIAENTASTTPSEKASLYIWWPSE